MEETPNQKTPPGKPTGLSEPDGAQAFAGPQMTYADPKAFQRALEKIVEHFAPALKKLAE